MATSGSPVCTGSYKDGRPCSSSAVRDSDPPRCRRHPPDKTLRPPQIAFLAAFAVLGNITDAAQQSGVDRSRHYEWLEDPMYVEGFEQAGEEAADRLEREARRRAVSGTTTPVLYKGKPVVDENGDPVVVRRYSDRLLELLLKAHRPEKYRERYDVTMDADVRHPQEEKLRDLLGNPAAIAAAEALASHLGTHAGNGASAN